MKELFAQPNIVRRRQRDGSFTLAARQPLGPYPQRITDHLVHWANKTPSRNFLAERGPDGAWQFLTYGEALLRSRSIGQYLLNQGCGPKKPVLCIGKNGLDTACFQLGALYAGVPYAPVSPSYASVPAAFDKLKACIDVLQPALAFLDSIDTYAEAVARACLHKIPFLSSSGNGDGSLEMAMSTPSSFVDTHNQTIDADSVAKYLFTSGSMGTPKGVTNTHRMLCANQKQLESIYPFLTQRAPILVDWLPWHHTFGGNEVFGMVMAHGGTLYIDAGKPMGRAIDTTIANLKSVSPTMYFNVPLGYEQLVSRMETDQVLRDMFFADLKLIFYSGAGMPQRTWVRLEQLAQEHVGRPIPLVTAWGATETAPLATGVHFESHRTDNIGVPVPGCEVKFALVDERYELRVRGPNVMPGYLGRPDLDEQVFDEEGFYKTGDSGVLIDEENPSAGIAFRGRIAEDFKLQSGVWVAVGRLRGLLMGELMPIASHVVIAGENRDSIGILIFLNKDASRKLIGDESLTIAQLAEHPELLTHVSRALEKHNRNNKGSSVRVERFAVIADEPSVEAREITDKGSINQAAVVSHRAAVLDSLWATECRRET